MFFIHVILSLLLWFPVAIIAVFVLSLVFTTINFSWYLALVLAIVTGIIVELVTKKGGH